MPYFGPRLENGRFGRKQKRSQPYGPRLANGKMSRKVQVVKRKVLGKVKKLLGARKVNISGTGYRGARISGRGAYSISEIGEKVAAPFFDDTRSQGTVNKVARFAGKTLGSAVGLGDEVGNATSWLSRAFGFGDYTIKKNSFQDYGNIAQFANHGTITFSHREYIMDINSSTGFTNSSYPINPGNSTLFPWLSTIAKNFEQYEFLGLIFEFKSTSATAVGSVNTGLGTVIMATDYDVLDSQYADKRAMEVAEFSTSAAPFNSQVHPIECDPKQNVMKQLFIQQGNTVSTYPDDPRFSALGNFQIATSGMQAVSTIGELWVSYHIKLLKPQLEDASTTSTTSMHIRAQTAPAGAPTLFEQETTNPGALTASVLSGPARIRLTCSSVAGIGTYLAGVSLISDAVDPTYLAVSTTLPLGGTTSIPLIANGSGGLKNTRGIFLQQVGTTKANCTFAENNNTVTSCTVFKFSSVGDTIDLNMTYSVTATTYIDWYIAPFRTNYVNALSTERAPMYDMEKLKQIVMDLQSKQAKTNNDFIELKREIEEVQEDNSYEVTVNSDDVARLVDKLASVNLVKNSASEIDDCLKATIDMLGKNLTLSDRIRLEHYYTNLKKYHL